MARRRYNGLKAALGADLTAAGTTVTFSAGLTYTGATGPGAQVPTIAAGDYVPLSIQNAQGVAEVVYLTAYTAGATTGTIQRGRDGTGGVAHTSGARVIQAATSGDFVGPSIYIPVTVALPSLGAPSLVSSGDSRPTGGYALDPSTQEAVTFVTGGPYEIPADWAKVLLRLHWSVLTNPGGTGSYAVVWDVYTYLEPTTNTGNWDPRRRLGTGLAAGGIPANGGTNLRRITDFNAGTAYELTERGRLAIEVRRFADTGSDTLPTDVVLSAIEIVRVD